MDLLIDIFLIEIDLLERPHYYKGWGFDSPVI